MKTMFDIDDVIEFNARGKVKEYSIKSCYDGPDDYYVLLIPTKNDIVQVYLSTKDLKAMHAKKVADVAEQTEWIPCNERLPEKDGLYLVTTSKGQVQSHIFNQNGNSQEYWLRCNKAWMPLPEPYQEGEHE